MRDVTGDPVVTQHGEQRGAVSGLVGVDRLPSKKHEGTGGKQQGEVGGVPDSRCHS